jgi:hypothetical protein
LHEMYAWGKAHGWEPVMLVDGRPVAMLDGRSQSTAASMTAATRTGVSGGAAAAARGVTLLPDTL